ncbi:MAG: DUF5688 family protein [Roseburia sp.]
MKEMNREEIEKVAEMVAEKASEKLGLETVVRTIDKVDRKLTGITVLNGKEICCSPTFYIDEYAPKIAEKLVTVEDVAEKMSHFYREKFSEDDVLNVYSMINNFDSIKEFLSLRIVNKTFNPEYLTDVPYIPYLDDFAIILGIDITLLHGNAFVKVTKHLLDLWGKEFAEVKAIAEMNDRKLPIQKIGMSDIIPCEEDMFFEVNNGRGNGAIIAYLFEDELKKLAKEHGGLYVSFSTIDTLMIFPNDRIPCGDKEIILKELTEVMLQANDEMPENLLGTKAYYFDPEHGFEF